MSLWTLAAAAVTHTVCGPAAVTPTLPPATRGCPQAVNGGQMGRRYATNRSPAIDERPRRPIVQSRAVTAAAAVAAAAAAVAYRANTVTALSRTRRSDAERRPAAD